MGSFFTGSGGTGIVDIGSWNPSGEGWVGESRTTLEEMEMRQRGTKSRQAKARAKAKRARKARRQNR